MSRIGIAHHTSKKRGTWSAEHGTPEHVIELVHRMFGHIDVDLASSMVFNKMIGAGGIFTKESPCPGDLDAGSFNGAIIYCNPPGPSTEVKRFFDIWQRTTRPRDSLIFRPNHGAFLIYNIDHWRMLQPTRPLWVLMFAKRLKFVGAKHQANFGSVLITTKKPPEGFGHILKWEPGGQRHE
jgi:hypothetical protein